MKQIRTNQGNQILYKNNELLNFYLDILQKLYHALYSFLEIFLTTALFFVGDGGHGKAIVSGEKPEQPDSVNVVQVFRCQVLG